MSKYSVNEKLSSDVRSLNNIINNNIKRDVISGINKKTKKTDFTININEKEYKYNFLNEEKEIRSEINIELVLKNYNETIRLLNLLEDKYYLFLTNNIINEILTIKESDIDQIDQIVLLKGTIYISNYEDFDTYLEKLDVLKHITIKHKYEYLQSIRQIINIPQLFTTNMTLEQLNKLIESYTMIPNTHKILLLDSPNVVWSGSSVHDIIYRSNCLNYTEYKDIDLFLIGTNDTKQTIIKQIITNLIDNFGKQNIIYGVSRSICNICIKGIPRSIQLICYENDQTTANDVIDHFDLDYLKTMICYDSDTKSYKLFSSIKSIYANQSKKILATDDIKSYRLLKAQEKGFKILWGSHKTTNSYDTYMLRKQQMIRSYYLETNNLTSEINNNDLNVLLGFVPLNNIDEINKIEYNGNFSNYNFENQYFPQIDINNRLIIITKAKLLSKSIYSLIFEIDTINDFGGEDMIVNFCYEFKEKLESNKSIKETTKPIIKKTAIFAINGELNVNKEYYKQFIDPESRSILVDCKYEDSPTSTFNYEVGKTYFCKFKFNAHLNDNDKIYYGISAKLMNIN